MERPLARLVRFPPASPARDGSIVRDRGGVRTRGGCRGWGRGLERGCAPPDGGGIPAYAGMTVMGVGSRFRGNDARPGDRGDGALRAEWIPAYAGMTILGRRDAEGYGVGSRFRGNDARPGD